MYVSDSWNHRIVKWDQDTKRGVVVAGGCGKGKNPDQLNYPAGVLVDQSGTVYVADSHNNRVMRWQSPDCGEVIAGDSFSKKHPKKMRSSLRAGNRRNQLNGPEGLAFDETGNLYVVDSNNYRVQRFKIQIS